MEKVLSALKMHVYIIHDFAIALYRAIKSRLSHVIHHPFSPILAIIFRSSLSLHSGAPADYLGSGRKGKMFKNGDGTGKKKQPQDSSAIL